MSAWNIRALPRSRSRVFWVASVAAAALVLVACTDGDDRRAPCWEVLHEGRASFLLGTMHDEVDADELPQRVWDELDRATVLTTEADVRFILHDEFLEAISLPDGASLSSLVSEEDWQDIVDAFEGMYSAEELERLQPWYLEGALVRTLVPTVDDPIDTTLVNEAIGAEVRLEFLETWQEQVSMLNGIGLDEGLWMLLRTVRDPEGAAAVHLAWADTYREGDVERLTELSFAPEDIEATPHYYEEIVFARNEAWLPVIESQLQQGGALIAVGFMHMLTDRGLVSLLETRGYAVNLVER